MIMALHLVDSVGADMFLIKITHDGDLYAHAVGTLSDVVNRLSDAAYARSIGETVDEIEVFALHAGIPTLVMVDYVRHEPIGFVEVRFRWEAPEGRFSVIKRTESGYYKIIDI